MNHSFGQGCSDAGFCSIDGFKPDDLDSSKTLKNQFKIGSFFGSADNSISVYGSYIEYNRQVNEKLDFDVKLTSIGQNGNDISVFGLSDAFLNSNYKINDNFKLTLGVKVPLTNANRSLDELPLPMDYQASLGTVDLLFGTGYKIKKFQIVAALQYPLTQNNNQFLSNEYLDVSALSFFQSTKNFKRSGDVLLRVSYPFSVTKKLKLTPSILPIYHLANDKYTDVLNIEREIIGSEGLTLNGNIYLDYKINQKNIMQLNIGAPFIYRDARPDGLTRSVIVSLEYRIKF